MKDGDAKALTKANQERERVYNAAKANALGDLHQRMKVVIERAREIDFWKIDTDLLLWQHIYDSTICKLRFPCMSQQNRLTEDE